MENLDDKVIVYDDACPICKAYTAGFVKVGWLKHRSGFAGATPEMLARIDLNRARHEIPLLDTQTGEVVYGLDALFLIIGEKWPVFRPLFRSRWFRALLYPLYQIITYNRRVIAGGRAPQTGFDCAPDVNLFYRWLYIFLAGSVAAWCSIPFWTSGDVPGKFFLSVHLALVGLVIFVAKRLDFMGHWATVWLATAVVGSLVPGPVWVGASVGIALTLLMWRMRWKSSAFMQKP